MSPIDQLKAVLCDPEGKCCISGSDEERAIVDRALQALESAVPETNFGNTADPFTYIIQHLNSNPYSLTKDECVSLVKELRDKYLEAAPGGER